MANSPIKLKKKQLKPLLSGLKALDGLRTSSSDIKYFNWDSKDAARIAINQVLVEPEVDALDRAKTLLMRAHHLNPAGETVNEGNAPRVAEYMEQFDDLCDQEVELGLGTIKHSILQKKGVPPSIVAQLWPIVEQDILMED